MSASFRWTTTDEPIILERTGKNGLMFEKLLFPLLKRKILFSNEKKFWPFKSLSFSLRIEKLKVLYLEIDNFGSGNSKQNDLNGL